MKEHSRRVNALMKNTVWDLLRVCTSQRAGTAHQGEPSDGVSVGSAGEEARSLSSGGSVTPLLEAAIQSRRGRGP